MPAFEAASAEAADLERWDALLDASLAGSVFHRLAFLRAMERETGTKLHALVVRDAAGPVALFPVFLRTGPLRFVFSPPPRCAVPELGPVLLRTGKTQSDREVVWWGVVAAAHAWIQRELRPDSVHLSCVPGVADVRPFTWAGYEAAPIFTYHISLTEGPSAVLAGWKPQVRTDLRRAAKYGELRLESGGAELLHRLVDRVRDRYREQGRTWPVSNRFFEALNDTLEGRLTVRALLAGDELVTGLGLLVDGGMVRHWFGGATPRGSYIGVNELLHWRVVEEFAAAGFHTYELMGANTEHLSRHKARYNPRLVTQYALRQANLPARAIEAVAASGALRQSLNRLRRRRVR